MLIISVECERIKSIYAS